MVLVLTHKVNQGANINFEGDFIDIIVRELNIWLPKAILEIRGIPCLMEITLSGFARHQVTKGIEIMISEKQLYNLATKIRIGYDAKEDYRIKKRNYYT